MSPDPFFCGGAVLLLGRSLVETGCRTGCKHLAGCCVCGDVNCERGTIFGSVPMTWNTGLFRSGWTTRVVLLGLALCTVSMAACRNCNERFCKAARILRVQGMTMSDGCCEFPEDPGCDLDLYSDFSNMTWLLHKAFVACDDDNIDTLKDVWREVKDIIPMGIILPWCHEIVLLDQWFRDLCNPFINSNLPAYIDDEFVFDLSLHKLQDAVQDRPQGQFANENTQMTFAVVPGSMVSASTWMGDAQFSVTGILAISALRLNENGEQQGTATQVDLDLIDSKNGVIGAVTLATHVDAKPLVLLDANGSGMIGMPVSIDVFWSSDPDGWNADGLLDVIWIELPISIDGNRASIVSDGPLAVFDLAPVDPAFIARFDTSDGNALAVPDSNIDPCDVILDANNMQYYRRTWEWSKRIKEAFPECFKNGK